MRQITHANVPTSAAPGHADSPSMPQDWILIEGHHIAYSPVDLAQWTAAYPAVRSSTLLSQAVADEAPEQDTEPGIRNEILDRTDPRERQHILERFMIEEVRELLGGISRHIDPHTSVVMLGLDSLGAVQLQQRLQYALRTSIQPGAIWVRPNAASLAEWHLQHRGFHVGAQGES
jgi:acyl carrier protein